MVEDPSLEIVETFSDWEYYSDDYYDDDPSIIKKQGTEGHHVDGPPRKKKRKLSLQQQENIPALSLGPAIVDDDSSPTDAKSFKGVLWRPRASLAKEDITLYEPGKGEKVALLSDWREVFKTSLIRKDWFQNGSGAESRQDDGNEPERVVREVTPEVPEMDVRENRYATYSPPPLEIDDMDKSINRQREKNIQSELGKPQSNLREMMVIGDSEEEAEDVEEAAPVEESAAPENEQIEEQEEQSEQQTEPTTRKTMLSVEVPAPSNVTNSSPPRKRGRKQKTEQQKSPVTTTPTTTSNNNNPLSNPKKRGASSIQADESDEHDSKRRSRRIASVSETKSEQKSVPAKSNRGRKKKV
jgi:hypothetical protein